MCLIISKAQDSLDKLEKRRRARSSRLPASPCGDLPVDLTEGGQPVVCWPSYLTLKMRKEFRLFLEKIKILMKSLRYTAENRPER